MDWLNTDTGISRLELARHSLEADAVGLGGLVALMLVICHFGISLVKRAHA
jgi:hypothetical protein